MLVSAIAESANMSRLAVFVRNVAFLRWSSRFSKGRCKTAVVGPIVSTSKTMKRGRALCLLPLPRCMTTSPSKTVPGLISGITEAIGSAPPLPLINGIDCFPRMARSTSTTVSPVKTMKCRTPSVFSLRKYLLPLWTSSMLWREKLTGMHPQNLVFDREGAGVASGLTRGSVPTSIGCPLCCWDDIPLSMNFLRAPQVASASWTAFLLGWSIRYSSTSTVSSSGLIWESIHHSCLARFCVSFCTCSGFSVFTSFSKTAGWSSISISYTTVFFDKSCFDVDVTSVTSICHPMLVSFRL
mmetsp:Transcript_990/g.2474  ORF Transcript_990/g.2474 Transcript_990/m.2474 type:complete len:297 (+) Transcript_990:1114-2004(+)